MLLHASHPGAPCRQARFSIAVVITGLFLCGCAGGGGGSSSANGSTVLCGTSEMNARPCSGGGPAPVQPARPAPTVTSESTTREQLPLSAAPVNRDASTFGAIVLQRPIEPETGKADYQWPGDNALRIRSDPATQTYTLLFNLPGQGHDETYDLIDPDFGYRIVTTTNYSDGQSIVSDISHYLIRGLQTGLEPANPEERTTKDLGFLTVLQATRNVSLGQQVIRELQWDPQERTWDTSAYGCYDCFGLDDDYQGKTRLYFAFGNRTAAADLPLSGIATFKLRSDNYERGYNAVAGNATWAPYLVDDILITADFGRQSIAATVDRSPEVRRRESVFGTSDVHYWGIRLHGESSYNQDGFFAIPMAGELISQDPAEPQRSIALTGRIDGAFFGPGAAEIGGVYAITNASGSFLFEGSFAGERQ